MRIESQGGRARVIWSAEQIGDRQVMNTVKAVLLGDRKKGPVVPKTTIHRVVGGSKIETTYATPLLELLGVENIDAVKINKSGLGWEMQYTSIVMPDLVLLLYRKAIELDAFGRNGREGFKGLTEALYDSAVTGDLKPEIESLVARVKR